MSDLSIIPLTANHWDALAKLFAEPGDPRWCWCQLQVRSRYGERGMDDYAMRVWNRAAIEEGGPDPGSGDRMLSAMLLAHGQIENGGVLNCFETLTSKQLAEAVRGYRYFGLDDVAAFMEREAAVPEGERTDADEQRLDLHYSTHLVPNDSVFDEPFRRRLQESPGDFAP